MGSSNTTILYKDYLQVHHAPFNMHNNHVIYVLIEST